MKKRKGICGVINQNRTYRERKSDANNNNTSSSTDATITTVDASTRNSEPPHNLGLVCPEVLLRQNNRIFFNRLSPEALLRQNTRRARAALLYYNEHNGSDFELVDIVHGRAHGARIAWHHVCFKARPKSTTASASNNVDGDDVSSKPPVIFFAEMYGAWKRTPYLNKRITFCSIVDPTTSAEGNGDIMCSPNCIDPTYRPPGFEPFLLRPEYPELARLLREKKRDIRLDSLEK